MYKKTFSFCALMVKCAITKTVWLARSQRRSIARPNSEAYHFLIALFIDTCTVHISVNSSFLQVGWRMNPDCLDVPSVLKC